MDQIQANYIAQLFFALGHRRRLLILELLRDRPETGRTLGMLENASGLARGTLIHHLRQMEKAGLVRRQQKGASTEYRFVPQPLQAYIAHLMAPQTTPAQRAA
mgnify:CR=1 FL=1